MLNFFPFPPIIYYKKITNYLKLGGNAMNINPLNSISWIDNIAKENNTKSKVKTETNDLVSVSQSHGATKERILSLKKSLAEISPRESKIKDAKELLKSGRIHSKEMARSAAEGMFKEENLADL